MEYSREYDPLAGARDCGYLKVQILDLEQPGLTMNGPTTPEKDLLCQSHTKIRRHEHIAIEEWRDFVPRNASTHGAPKTIYYITTED